RLVEWLGLRAHAVSGHSVGEIAAAHVAGVLSMEDACRLVEARGRLMQALPEGGAMLAVQIDEAAAVSALEGLEDRVGIAAVNGPSSVVVSGDEKTIAALEQDWQKAGVRTKRLTVSHAFHSPLMDPMLDDFRAVVTQLVFNEPRLAGLSPEVTDPEYWVQHIRRTVRFTDAITALNDEGVTRWLELGPDAVLTALAQQILDDTDGHVFTPSLRAGRPETETFLTALAALHVHGTDINWTRLCSTWGGRRIGLPTYPFQRDWYWLSPDPATIAPQGAHPDGDPAEAGFWAAVESGDADALYSTLAVDAEAGRSSLDVVLPALAEWRRSRKAQTRMDSWSYRTEWETTPEPGTASLSGSWLLIGADERTAGLGRTMAALGAEVVHVRVTGTYEELPAAIAAASSDAAGLSGVVSFLALDDQDEPHTATALLLETLSATGATVPLWTLTRGAVAVSPSDRIESLRQARLWGYGRTAAREHRELWGGLVDLPAQANPAEEDGRVWRRLCALMSAAAPVEDQLALRSSGLHARRVVRAPLARQDAVPAYRPSGTVLVTMGDGEPERHLVRSLAEEGAGHLVLLDPVARTAVADLVGELRDAGHSASVAVCDPADRTALAEVLRAVPQDRPLTAVIHAQATGDRVTGALSLHELTAAHPLDAFVLFTSAAGLWGLGGDAATAGDDAALEALAALRRAAGLASTCLGWGVWEGNPPEGLTWEHLYDRGLLPLSADLAVTAFRQAVAGRAAGGETTTTVLADIDWSRFAPAFTATRTAPLLHRLPEARQAMDTAPAAPADHGPDHEEHAAAGALRDRLRAVDRAGREQLLLDLVREAAAAVLSHGDIDAVPPGQQFRQLGLDSMMAVELRNRLARATGLTLPATLVFDHPAPASVARYLLAELLRNEPGTGEDVLTQLERLKATLTALPPGTAELDRIAGDLGALLTQVGETRALAFGGHAAHHDDSDEDEFDGASADEMLDLIEKEFGKS
ncbi:acyltransferase domain-containing protein, partial [Streptomyces sp. NPDC049687]|uniref:acyltransferase domain-containing protein n=1 Tax=Streptomyces sp. NPDC049687 TaxID=3365596 RepID=UPI0037AE761C